MKSVRLLRTISMASLFALTAACQSRVVIPPAPSCADLIPEEWSEGVAGANFPPDRGPLPVELDKRVLRLGQDLTDSRVYGNEQGAALSKANGRTKDSIGIVKRCEARDQAVAAKLSAPWWKRPFMRLPDG